MATRFTHVSFDLDGTLLDTRSQIIESVLACLRADEREAARPIVAQSLDDSPKAILRRFGISKLDGYWSNHSTLAHLAHPFFPDTPAILDRLRGDGVSLSVITSLPARPAHALLRRAGLEDRFSLIDTYASRPYRKPSPQLLTLHLKELNSRPAAAAYVGDSTGDMRMAKSAGATAIGVGWSSAGIDALIAAGADTILESLHELVETI